MALRRLTAALAAAALAVTADRWNPQEGMLGIHPFMVSQSEDFQNEEGVTEYAPKYLVDLVKDGHNFVKAQAKEGREEDACVFLHSRHVLQQLVLVHIEQMPLGFRV